MRVALLGLGLIGGSIGLAARRVDWVETVGFDPDRGAAARAREIGAVGELAGSVEEAVAGAEVAFAAAPVGALEEVVRAALRAAERGCVVTDVGSTKRSLLDALGSAPGIERFVGGHPLAGSERAGVEHARADLFDGAIWFLTPARAADSGRLEALLRGIGAVPVRLDAAAHDALLARMSHLPHVLANVLVAAAARQGERELELAGCGPSFRDATRVAGASSAIWTDIYMANADQLSAAIDEVAAELTRVGELLRAHDRAGLAAWNELARERRERSRRRSG
ncbi:MAG: prephenate dehydrogenase [Solirubrobacteraceae bacterium]